MRPWRKRAQCPKDEETPGNFINRRRVSLFRASLLFCRVYAASIYYCTGFVKEGGRPGFFQSWNSKANRISNTQENWSAPRASTALITCLPQVGRCILQTTRAHISRHSTAARAAGLACCCRKLALVLVLFFLFFDGRRLLLVMSREVRGVALWDSHTTSQQTEDTGTAFRVQHEELLGVILARHLLKSTFPACATFTAEEGARPQRMPDKRTKSASRTSAAGCWVLCVACCVCWVL